MKKTITVTVSYPVTFQIEIDDSKEFSDIREEVLIKADQFFESSSIRPIIIDSSMDELIN